MTALGGLFGQRERQSGFAHRRTGCEDEEFSGLEAGECLIELGVLGTHPGDAAGLLTAPVECSGQVFGHLVGGSRTCAMGVVECSVVQRAIRGGHASGQAGQKRYAADRLVFLVAGQAFGKGDVVDRRVGVLELAHGDEYRAVLEIENASGDTSATWSRSSLCRSSRSRK